MAQRIALELALYQPDLVTLPESAREDLVAEVAERLEMNYACLGGELVVFE